MGRLPAVKDVLSLAARNDRLVQDALESGCSDEAILVNHVSLLKRTLTTELQEHRCQGQRRLPGKEGSFHELLLGLDQDEFGICSDSTWQKFPIKHWQLLSRKINRLCTGSICLPLSADKE